MLRLSFESSLDYHQVVLIQQGSVLHGGKPSVLNEIRTEPTHRA